MPYLFVSNFMIHTAMCRQKAKLQNHFKIYAITSKIPALRKKTDYSVLDDEFSSFFSISRFV